MLSRGKPGRVRTLRWHRRRWTWGTGKLNRLLHQETVGGARHERRLLRAVLRVSWPGRVSLRLTHEMWFAGTSYEQRSPPEIPRSTSTAVPTGALRSVRLVRNSSCLLDDVKYNSELRSARGLRNVGSGRIALDAGRGPLEWYRNRLRSETSVP